MTRAFAADVTNTETVSATVNGGQPVTYMIDSGATYTILADTTATQIGFDTTNPSGTQPITSVTGQTNASVFNVSMKINDTVPFDTQILVMPSAFNLLATEDLAKAYSVSLDPSGVGFHLTPLGQAPTTPQTPTPTVPQQPSPTQPAPPPPTTPTTPTPPIAPIQSLGKMVIDFVRQLYQTLCGGQVRIPFLCNNPNIFMFSMMLLGLIVLILMAKGVAG